MRVGLVAVGAALAVVGASVIVAVLLPANDPTVTRSASADVVDLTGGDWRNFVLPASASDPATLTLSWVASAPVNVTLYACASSPAPCVVEGSMASWVGNLTGRWVWTGPVGGMYDLEVEAPNGGASSMNVSALLLEDYRPAPLPLPMVPFVLTIVAGALLAGIGAVAVYLGLFLPPGTYAPSVEPWDERFAEEVAGGPTGPARAAASGDESDDDDDDDEDDEDEPDAA